MMQDAQDLAIATLARCTAFQALVSASGVPGARQRIFADVLPAPKADAYTAEELQALRPFALVFTQDDLSGFRYVKQATGGCWTAGGTIICKLEKAVAASESATVADRKFREAVGKIVPEYANLCETAGCLASTRIDASGPFRVAAEDVEDLGDHQWFELQIQWGIGQ